MSASAAGDERDGGESGREDDVAASLTTVLVKTLRALGKAGEPDEGLQLAARAWSALRHRHPGEAERINGTMHFLARMPTSAPVDGTGGPAARPEESPGSTPGSQEEGGNIPPAGTEPRGK